MGSKKYKYKHKSENIQAMVRFMKQGVRNDDALTDAMNEAGYKNQWGEPYTRQQMSSFRANAGFTYYSKRGRPYDSVNNTTTATVQPVLSNAAQKKCTQLPENKTALRPSFVVEAMLLDTIMTDTAKVKAIKSYYGLD